MTLYQVSENIFDLFDRVLLVDQGRCVYYGPRDQARQYFRSHGYCAPERQTTPDFLTSVTDPNEARYNRDFKGRCPRTAEERELAWKRSSLYADLQRELKEVGSLIHLLWVDVHFMPRFFVSSTSITTTQEPRVHLK